MAGEFKISFSTAKAKTGAKPGLSALGTKSSTSTNGQPPAKKLKLLGDDEPEDGNTSVEISGWDSAAGGAVDANGAAGKKEKEKLVIPALPNRYSRGDRRPPGAAGAASAAEQAEKAAAAEKAETEVKYGLQFLPKREDGATAEDQKAAAQKQLQAISEAESANDGLTEEQRLEKQALEALLRGDSGAVEQTVIPTLPDEDAAFSHDFESAPEAPSLDDYAAVPVEGFGAAMLRGMGWKDGEEIGRKRGSGTAAPKPREVKKRAEFLGIGAKPDAQVGGAKEGGWARGKEKPTYQPVVLRNKVTGEVVSEEELKARLEAQKLVGEEGDRSDRGERKEKRREREKDRYIEDADEYERRKERKRMERDDYREKDRERDRDRDRRREEESRDRRDRDRDRYREKERESDSRRKDRRRDDEYDDRKKDSKRSYDYSDDERRHEKRRDRERDRRDKSRSRDSDDKRKRRRDYDDEPEDRKRRHRDDGYRR
jgi:hypothetical protein